MSNGSFGGLREKLVHALGEGRAASVPSQKFAA